jgi:hypothetical protein
MKARIEPQKAVKSDRGTSQAAEVEAAAQYIDEFGPRPKQRFGALRQKLGVEEIPGFEQRWINDVPGRVDYAKECGYAHVEDKEGKPIYRVVGKDGMRAYLLKIPKVWYDEAKAEEQEEHVDSVERDIFRGKAGNLSAGNNGAYIPTEGPGGPSRIKVNVSDRPFRQ